MKFTRNILVPGVLIASAFAAGYRLHNPATAGPAPGTAKPLYYRDPMHPWYRADKPGKAPDCGMDLEPVYSEDAAAGNVSPVPVPGAIRLSDERRQMIGLVTEPVTTGSGRRVVRLPGRVAVDESRVFRVVALAEGVVRSIAPVGVGSKVKKDELLASYFVSQRDLYNAFQNFFAANNNLDRALSSMDQSMMDTRNAQIRLTEELLQTYGVTETQMREMATSRQVTRDLQFRAPAAGLILSRTVSTGQKLDRGTELFRIADLRHVWVLADAFERDSARIRPGASAHVHYQGRTYTGVISDARDFDARSRTLKIRLDLENPDLALRPDMFVELELEVTEESGVDVPVDAVLNTGQRAVVFVAGDNGTFQPREVTPGDSGGGRVRIVKGLSAGENVVVSGVFLLDSESRLQMEAHRQKEPAPVSAETGATDPVCGMKLTGTESLRGEYQGTRYHFCSKTCQSKFDAHPEHYAVSAVKHDPTAPETAGMRR